METLAQATAGQPKRDIKLIRKQYILHAYNEGLVNFSTTKRTMAFHYLNACRFHRNGVRTSRMPCSRALFVRNFQARIKMVKEYLLLASTLPG